MHKVRLLLFPLCLALAVGAASMARGQDGTFQDQSQNQARDSKHDKAKNKNNDGHRKHWWSPPHLFHKNAAGTSPVNKTAATTNSGNKTVAGKPGQKTVAKTGQGHRAVAGTNRGRRTTAGTSHAAKTVHHDCTPEEAKKGGCQASKRSKKGTASPS